jgi:hypothetical protein
MEKKIERLMCNNKSVNTHFLNNPKFTPCCTKSQCNDCIRAQCKSNSKRRDSTNTVQYKLNCILCEKETLVKITTEEECLLDSDIQACKELEIDKKEINEFLENKLNNLKKNIQSKK